MTKEEQIAEQATGCSGAGGYRRWAERRGFKHLHVLDWTSSAGDWTFIVSRDGYEWFVMSQSNNYPRPGFSYGVNEDLPFYGDSQEALQEAAKLFGG